MQDEYCFNVFGWLFVVVCMDGCWVVFDFGVEGK